MSSRSWGNIIWLFVSFHPMVLVLCVLSLNRKLIVCVCVSWVCTEYVLGFFFRWNVNIPECMTFCLGRNTRRESNTACCPLQHACFTCAFRMYLLYAFRMCLDDLSFFVWSVGLEKNSDCLIFRPFVLRRNRGVFFLPYRNVNLAELNKSCL